MKNIETELWRIVTGFEYYMVSNIGRIKSLDRRVYTGIKHNNTVLRRGKILTPSINKYGYLQIVLYKEKKAFNKTIHQLVALEFIPNPNNFPDINHKDTIKIHNEESNLEWCTPGMNNIHAVENRLFPHGEKSHKTTLTIEEVRSIRIEYCKSMSSIKLALKYSVSKPTILNILKGKTWKYDT